MYYSAKVFLAQYAQKKRLILEIKLKFLLVFYLNFHLNLFNPRTIFPYLPQDLSIQPFQN